MDFELDAARLLRLARDDRELSHKLAGLASAVVRFEFPWVLGLEIADGRVTSLAPEQAAADVRLGADADFWNRAVEPVPAPGYESLTVGAVKGLLLEGDLATMIAPYHPAWARLFELVGEARRGPVQRSTADPEPFRATDTAIGRYAYIRVGVTEYRVYYESAGTGPLTLLLQHTAGADGRQWRHLLADPELQRDFTIIAYDLPYHGRSLPPTPHAWWEEDYEATQRSLMAFVLAFADALKLERPVFMGCSVGGQLALDLAAFHAERFGAFVSINGWYDGAAFEDFSNGPFRLPNLSSNLPASLCAGATAPRAPLANRHETYWIYRSNFPGVYAGDNDYFMRGHDLGRDGHRIDARRTPVYLLTGEYDHSVHFDASGAAAVARNIPGLIHHVLPGLGHFAPSDDPIGFREAVLPILRRLRDDLSAFAPLNLKNEVSPEDI